MEIWFKINATMAVVVLFGLLIGRICEVESDWFIYPLGAVLAFALVSWPIYLIAKLWL